MIVEGLSILILPVQRGPENSEKGSPAVHVQPSPSQHCSLKQVPSQQMAPEDSLCCPAPQQRLRPTWGSPTLRSV